METRITTGTFVALACSVVLVYAAPQKRPPSSGAPPGASATGHLGDGDTPTTTITGCLRQGSSPRSFVLTQSPGTSVPNGGIGSAGARDPQGIRYELVPDSKTDLSKMVGHQVQATGTRTIGPLGSPPPPINPGARADDRPRPSTGGPDKNLSSPRTADQTTVGGGTAERTRGPADADLTRFNLQSIKQTGSAC